VLRLLETGDISAGEAESLLEALSMAEQSGSWRDNPANTEAGKPARTVRVRISDPTTGRATINLALPIGLIDAGLNVARRFAPDKVPSAETMRQSITSDMAGTLLDVVDANERIEIIVEP
jgi:hypothetical protein